MVAELLGLPELRGHEDPELGLSLTTINVRMKRSETNQYCSILLVIYLNFFHSTKTNIKETFFKYLFSMQVEGLRSGPLYCLTFYPSVLAADIHFVRVPKRDQLLWGQSLVL
jgi:hypothetical protein